MMSGHDHIPSSDIMIITVVSVVSDSVCPAGEWSNYQTRLLTSLAPFSTFLSVLSLGIFGRLEPLYLSNPNNLNFPSHLELWIMWIVYSTPVISVLSIRCLPSSGHILRRQAIIY